MFERLSATEKRLLERIAKSNKILLAKRATIILISNEAATPAEIARVVEFTPRTVKRWQDRFAQQRLTIFSDTALNQFELSPTNQLEEEHNSMSTVDKSAKKKQSVTVELHRETKESTTTSAVNLPSPVNSVYPVTNVPETKKSKLIGLQPTDSLAEAGRKVLAFHFSRMLHHEAGTRLGEDIEELHDMRVATRRMRAAFRVFEDGFSPEAVQPLLKGLKKTARALGWVRDMDVFIEKFLAYQKTLPADEQAGLTPLLDYCYKQRDKARAKMIRYLDSKKYLKFKNKFRHFAETPGLGAKPQPTDQPVPYQLRHVTPVLIYTRYEAVRAYEPLLQDAPIEMLHQLRISFKRFRYALENFREILGAEGELAIREIKTMQNHLGDLNDAEVASNFVQDFVDQGPKRTKKSDDNDRPPQAIESYLQAKLAERQQLKETFPQAWEQFNTPAFRQHLALAVASL